MKFNLKNSALSAGINPETTKFLLAVSGGSDSIFLFHTFLSSGYHFEVAHCNFQLRGSESDKEEEFVSNLCETNGIKCHIQKFETDKTANENKESIQITARNLRYSWFNELLTENNLDLIVTAHHLDDRIETFFLNLFRGSGISGLAPIPLLNGNRFRPLIQIQKDEILDYLKENKLTFKEDSSNLSTKYSRNQIRLELLPEIEKQFPDYKTSFQKNFDRIESTISYIEKEKNKYLEANLEQLQNSWSIKTKSLTDKIHLQWLAEKFNGHFVHIGEIEKLLLAQKGKSFKIEDFTFTREADSIEIKIHVTKSEEINFQVDQLPFENEHVEIRLSESQPISFRNDEIYLNSAKVHIPLNIRNWTAGDRFVPLGMKGSKLVSDYLTDRKIKSSNRNEVLIVESKNNIIGILNHCCSDSYKVESENSNTLIIRLK